MNTAENKGDVVCDDCTAFFVPLEARQRTD